MILHHADCLDILPTIPDHSIDMICADLPYGTTDCHWDSIIPLDRLWEQYRRIIKRNRGIILTACQPFTSKLVMSNLKQFRHEWIWAKSIPTGWLDANRKPLRQHESVLVFSDGAPLYNPQKTKAPLRVRKHGGGTDIYAKHECVTTSNKGEAYPRTILYFPRERIRGVKHPTRKPVALMAYLIATYSKEGDTVLDNCMGSGTTGVAARMLQRGFIGIEKEKQYYELAVERLTPAIDFAEPQSVGR